MALIPCLNAYFKAVIVAFSFSTLLAISACGGASLATLSKGTPTNSQGTAGKPDVSALYCVSAAMTGSGTDLCTVTLSAAVPGGGQIINISSSSSAVTVPDTVTVPASATSVGFTATISSVAAAQTVTITASVGSVFKNFALQLNAAILALSINATNVAYGDVVVNTSATQSVTLTSSGTMPVTIGGAVITGAGFTFSGPAFPATLNPGQQATLYIEFNPPTIGAAEGQLTVSSNSSTNGKAVIGLSGTGAAQPLVAVAMTPTIASVTTEATQQFTASVTGSSDTAVTWNVSGMGCSGTACGTISSTGLYTAPASVPRSAAVSITATSGSDPTKSASANVTIVPPQAAGYNLAWEDTFSTLSLCTSNVPGCNWYNPGLWWETAAGTISNPSGNYVNLDWASGQANNTNISTTSPDGAYYHSWTYGYFEVSMAFDPVTGSSPAIWMFAEQGITGGPNSTSGELDIFEWQSSSPTTGYGTAHVWQNGVNIGGNGTTDAWTIPQGTNLANYNNYGVLWTPKSISWYFNNHLMETIDTSSVPYSTVYGGSESYFLILSQQAGCNWVGACTGQVSPLDMKVQWVHIYAAPPK